MRPRSVMRLPYGPAAIPPIGTEDWPLKQSACNTALRNLAALALALCGFAACASPGPEEEVMLSAARAGNVVLFRAMIKAGANVHARDDSGNNALVFAALSDREEMLREVLGHKVELDARGSIGMTALGIATAHNAPQAVERLLRAGADPDRADANGVTPLASALRLGRPSLAARLLAAGANPRITDRDGVTPLHVAAERGDLASATALLEHGADPNALDHERRSPLFVALFFHHPEIADAIVGRRETNLTLLTQGYTPAYWAKQMGYDDIARSISARLRKG